MPSQSTETRQLQPVPHHKEYRRPITEILHDLAQPVPKRFIEQRKQGGVMLDYIPWFNGVKLLDYFAPGWQGQIGQLLTTSDRLVLTALKPCTYALILRLNSARSKRSRAASAALMRPIN